MADTRMNRAEREDFLAAPRIGVLSIPQPADKPAPPLAAPVWYDYTKGGALWLLTGPNSAKGKLLVVNGKVTLVAQQEAMPYAYVSVECTVADIREANETDNLEMAHRYLGKEMGDAYAKSNTGNVSVRVELSIDRWLTVDYAKMSL